MAREVLLRPEDSMGTVLKKLRSLMEEQGMVIVEFPTCDEFEVSVIRYYKISRKRLARPGPQENVFVVFVVHSNLVRYIFLRVQNFTKKAS